MGFIAGGLPLGVIKELVEKRIAFISRMNLRVIDLKPLYVKLSVPLQGNENHVGGMFSGALFTIAEIPGGILCLTAFDGSKYYPTVKEMNLKFIRPALSDVAIESSLAVEDAVRIRDESESKGKAEFVLEGRILNDLGEVVATSRGVYQLRRIGT